MKSHILTAIVFLTCSVGDAYAPEGLETYALMPNPDSTVFVNGFYTNRNFLTDDEEMQIYFTSLTDGGHAFSFGSSFTVANQLGDRQAFFARQDIVFLDTHSVALKIAHEDWKYIASSKDSFGLEFAGFVGEEGFGTYYSVGGYYRLLRQRWNDKWWVPFNTDTDDQEGYLVGLLGVKFGFGSGSYLTMDVNMRDTFRYYHMDNVATDAMLSMNITDGFYLRFFGGIRWSALLVGVGAPSMYYGGIGIASK